MLFLEGVTDGSFRGPAAIEWSDALEGKIACGDSVLIGQWSEIGARTRLDCDRAGQPRWVQVKRIGLRNGQLQRKTGCRDAADLALSEQLCRGELKSIAQLKIVLSEETPALFPGRNVFSRVFVVKVGLPWTQTRSR